MHNDKIKTTSFDRVRQLLPQLVVQFDDANEEVKTAIPRIPFLVTCPITSNHQKPTCAAFGAVSRRKLKGIQEDTKGVLQSWVGDLDNTIVPLPTDNNRNLTPPPRQSKQIAEKNLSFDASSLLVQATITEDEKRFPYQNERNLWTDKRALMLIDYHKLPRNSGVVGSHSMFKRKDCGCIKAGIVPWGHRNLEEQELRIDSPCLNLKIFRLVLLIAAKQKWEIAQMDITAALLQARAFKREVLVRL